MSDKEILLDCLETEKNMSVNMTYALNESSHEALYNELFNMFEEINESAKELYAIAYNLGYYQLKAEKGTNIETSVQTLSKELTTALENENAK